MFPPPDTDDIRELRKWCEDFYQYYMEMSQKLGGLEHLESTEQTSITWQNVVDEFAKGIARRQ